MKKHALFATSVGLTVLCCCFMSISNSKELNLANASKQGDQFFYNTEEREAIADLEKDSHITPDKIANLKESNRQLMKISFYTLLPVLGYFLYDIKDLPPALIYERLKSTGMTFAAAYLIAAYLPFYDELLMDSQDAADDFVNICSRTVFAAKKYDTVDELLSAISLDHYWGQKDIMVCAIVLDYLIGQSGLAIELLRQWWRPFVAGRLKKSYQYRAILKHNRLLLAPIYDHEMAKRREQHIEKF
jgi:hypothetical protein